MGGWGGRGGRRREGGGGEGYAGFQSRRVGVGGVVEEVVKVGREGRGDGLRPNCQRPGGGPEGRERGAGMAVGELGEEAVSTVGVVDGE